ncbi:flagellar hook-basal body complex protein, partial [Telmatospirillum sp.]|uniref:flagellar hook protein FlgE n=1 Tax=Telmatospirillum sp. TaxID=2079197 RepID=UPI002850A838
MNTAVSGLSAQSAAFGNISDNIANSQTVGYKGVDTSFSDYLTTSSASVNDPGSVVATPDYLNTVQGTVSESTDTLSLAISGQGFFSVSQPTGTGASGKTTFASEQYYTRAGDFQLNSDGYLTNGAGQYLNVWAASSSGVLDKSTVVPIQVSTSVYKPVATGTMTMAANLPSGLISTVSEDANGNVSAMYDSSGTQVSALQADSDIYDAQGTSHAVKYTWTPCASTTANSDGTYDTVANSWNVSATMDGKDLGEVQVNFNADGTLAGVGTLTNGSVSTSGTGGATPGSTLIGAAPTYDNSTSGAVTYDTGLTSADGSTQKVTLNLGTIAGTDGVTQFAATTFTLRDLSQDGVPPGSFSSVSTKSDGDIYANYSNGQTRLIAQVPIATFSNADALQRQNGASFTATMDSGNATLQDSGSNGAGKLVTSSVESSNVDLATQFTKLIVAQQAYSANTKVITTADQLLQTTINMKT